MQGLTKLFCLHATSCRCKYWHNWFMCLCLMCVWLLYLYPGQLWRPNLALLGVVWWPRWLWCGCRGFPPSASPHRPAPSGGDGGPLHSKPTAPHMPRGGTDQSPPHPDIPTCPYQGRLAARRSRGSGLTQHPTHTLLHWEESFTREPRNWSHRERFQRHGKRHGLGMKKKSEICWS